MVILVKLVQVISVSEGEGEGAVVHFPEKQFSDDMVQLFSSSW